MSSSILFLHTSEKEYARNCSVELMGNFLTFFDTLVERICPEVLCGVPGLFPYSRDTASSLAYIRKFTQNIHKTHANQPK